MNISGKKLALFAVVAVVLIGACILLLIPKGTAEQTQSNIFEGDFLPISVTIDNEHGLYEITRAQDGTAQISDIDDESLSKGLADSVFYDMSAVAGKFIEEATQDSLGKYALDEPRASAKLMDEQGNEINLYLGAKSPIAEEYYMMTDDAEKGIFLVDAYYVDTLLRPIESYIDMNLIDYIYETDLDELERVEIVIENRLPIEFTATPDGFMMTKPIEHLGMQDFAKVQMLVPIMLLKPTDIAENVSFEDAGLADASTTITLDYKGKETVIYLGDIIGTKRYIASSDSENVYTIDVDSLKFLEADYRTLLGEVVYFRSIGDVEAVHIEMDDKEYDFAIEALDRETYDVELDGEKTSSSDFISLYNRIIGLPFSQNAPEHEDLPANIVITLKLSDGREDVVELISLDERNYVVGVNGNYEFTTLANYVDMIVEKIEVFDTEE